jgi:serine/threonine protein kinase
MASSKPAIPEPTEIAGRYVIEKKLGAGAFGTVYKAKDKVLGRMVAIKTIRLEGLAAQGAGLEEMLQRFTREARVSAQIKHPNIVTVHDLGNADGLSYLAMEFIDGVGLEKIIQGGRLSVERAASLAAQVADALDFAHRHGAVHRDIKPANIMVETGDRVKVTDFGIARFTESAEHLTMTGSLLGTPSYMSPEQARGGDIDGRSDLFSVGCVLYEMLGGRKAFRGDTITALIFKIITEEPPPLRELAADVPDAALRIVEKALSKTPENRYQSGREMADDLLALTRASAVPTLRQAEVQTVPAHPSGAIPTVVLPGTLGAPPIQASVPTRIAKPVTPPPPAAVSPAPATAPPPLPRPSPPAPRSTAPAPAPRKSGGGAGLVIGLGIGGLLLAALAGMAGYYLFLRKPPDSGVKVAENVSPRDVPSTTAVATPEPSVPATPEVAPTTLAAAAPSTTLAAATIPVVPPPTAGAAATPKARPVQPSVAEGARPARRAQDLPPPVGDSRSAGSSTFLDEEPPQVDGAEAGARVAEGFRSGGGRTSTFGASGRHERRERSPRPLVPEEAPAIATLRHILQAQEAFNQSTGRYGNFTEMAAARNLFLDLSPQANAFQRRGYRFDLQVSGGGFRVVAQPQMAGPRPFVGDDSGYIRAGLE